MQDARRRLSAARRRTRVAAGWSGGLFFSDDGGQSWANRSPPGSPILNVAELAWTADGSCAVVVYGSGAGLEPQAFLSGEQWRKWWQVPDPAGSPIVARASRVD